MTEQQKIITNGAETPPIFGEIPCVLELFGHNRIAGRVSEVRLGSTVLLKVEVPPVDDQPGFTKYYGVSAVYAMTVSDDETVVAVLRRLRPAPIDPALLQDNPRPFGQRSPFAREDEDFGAIADREYALHKDDFDDDDEYAEEFFDDGDEEVEA